MPKARRLAALALVLLAGCGGEDEPDAKKQAAALTPFPTVDFADLEAGKTYTTRAFKPSFTLTVPEGEWKAASADKPDHVELELVPEPPVQVAGFGFHHMTKVFPPEEGGEIPGDAVDGPDDFAAWLTSHPHLEASDPEPVEVMGLKGVSVDVTVKSAQPKQYKDCGKVEGKCVVMYVGGIETYVYGSQTKGRFLILEQPDGKELVIEQFVEPKKAFDDQVKAFEEALASAKLAE